MKNFTKKWLTLKSMEKMTDPNVTNKILDRSILNEFEGRLQEESGRIGGA